MLRRWNRIKHGQSRCCTSCLVFIVGLWFAGLLLWTATRRWMRRKAPRPKTGKLGNLWESCAAPKDANTASTLPKTATATTAFTRWAICPCVFSMIGRFALFLFIYFFHKFSDFMRWTFLKFNVYVFNYTFNMYVF